MYSGAILWIMTGPRVATERCAAFDPTFEGEELRSPSLLAYRLLLPILMGTARTPPIRGGCHGLLYLGLVLQLIARTRIKWQQHSNVLLQNCSRVLQNCCEVLCCSALLRECWEHCSTGVKRCSIVARCCRIQRSAAQLQRNAYNLQRISAE